MELHTMYLMTNQQFAKNTNFLPDDHPLTVQLGKGWKISGKTNIPYKDIALIQDDDVRVEATIQSGNPIIADGKKPARDYIHFELPTVVNGQPSVVPYWFWITDFSGNKKFNIYAFQSEDEVKAKQQESIKFAGYPPKNTGQTTIQTPPTTQQVVSKAAPLQTHQVVGNDVSGTLAEQKSFIKTIEDLKEVTLGSPDYVGYTETGYNIVPVELCNPNIWRDPCYDNEGNLTGYELTVLLGRIINVEIPTINSND